MKRTTVLKTIIAMTVTFGLNACTDAEVASMKQDIDDAQNNSGLVRTAQSDCKNYITEKFDLPMAAVSIMGGNHYGSTTTVPVRVQWDNPRVDERGECKVTNGDVSYRAFD